MKAKNRGMLRVDRVGDRGSYAILAQIFLHQTPPQHKKRGGAGLWAGADADQEVQRSGNYAGLEPECFVLLRGLPAVWGMPP